MSNNELQKEASDKYSLSGRVFNVLREDILSGKYKENEELKEAAIGKELGVSRTPVREALRQLELEGLVNIVPNKGAYVTGISLKDIKDIYEIRSLLEGLCARWAAQNITQKQLEELEENTFLSEFHAKKGHSEQIVELDNKFHEILYEASNSKILENMLSDFHHYVQRVRKITLASQERAITSNDEHRKILNALQERNAKEAEKLANIHMKNTIKNMDDYGFENLMNCKQEDK